jgi:hypothetical protein
MNMGTTLAALCVDLQGARQALHGPWQRRAVDGLSEMTDTRSLAKQLVWQAC